MINIAVWSQVLVPGKRIRVIPMSDFRLTFATFGEQIVDENTRTTIKLYRLAPKDEDEEDDSEDDEANQNEPEFETDPVIIGHLVPGRIEGQVMNIVFLDDEPIEFEITGKNTVHLVGNYIDQTPMGPGGPNPYDSDLDSDEEGYNLGEVSSDVEINPNDIMGLENNDDSDEEMTSKIEEVPPPMTKKQKKRARENDSATPKDQPKEQKDKKENNKKQKTESGAAVPTGEKAEKKEIKTKKTAKGKKWTTKGGVIIDERTTVPGQGCKTGQRLDMRYIGKLSNGTVFDKNVSGKPFSFRIGKGEVIKGWDEGLIGMTPGSERILTIPPELAYGKKKQDGIPANSALTFEVKLLAMKD